MGQFILDGIQFTADNSTLSTAGKKSVKFGNSNNAAFAQQQVNAIGVKPFINAVEIDWNAAILPAYSTTTGLNTTGEILTILNIAYNFSKTTFKTINGKSIVGSGDIEIKGGGGTVTSITPGTGLTGTSSDVAITSSGTINLKNASTSEIGGVKAAAVRTSAITTTQGGTTTGRYYGVEIDSNGKAFVNVPWTDTDKNDTVSSVSNHYKPNNTDQTKSSGLYKITTDAAGHITSATLVTQDDIVALIGDYFDSRYQKNKDVQISIPTSITRTKSSTVTSISKTGGSIKPAEIKVGEKSTITAPDSITVTYSLTNTTDTITISGADAVNQTPIVTSSNPSVIAVSGTTLTAKAAGKSTITVVCNGVTKEQEVSVSNASNTSKITSGWEYSASNNCVTINGTQIEGKSAGTPTIYVTYNNQNASLGTLTVKSAVNYYWYVGNKSPEGMTPPSVGNANATLCAWTDLGASLPTTSIKVYKEDENYDDHTWYVAAPTAAGFTIYNGLNAQPDLGWVKSKTFMIGDVSYDLWTSGSKFDTANIYLHK